MFSLAHLSLQFKIPIDVGMRLSKAFDVAAGYVGSTYTMLSYHAVNSARGEYCTCTQELILMNACASVVISYTYC